MENTNNFTSPNTKQEIVDAIGNLFADVLTKYNPHDERTIGAYYVMIDLLTRITFHQK